MIPFVIITVTLFFMSFRIVKKMWIGLVYRYGQFSGRILREGWHFIWPILEEARMYPAKVQSRPVSVTIETKEPDETSLRVKIDGRIEFFPNPLLMGRYRFETEESIVNGSGDNIKQELNFVGGKVGSADFIGSKETIQLIINSVLRLRDLPHRHGKNFSHNKDFIEPEERLSFYRDNKKVIAGLLEAAENDFANWSQTEYRYGIHIRNFLLSDIAFSKATHQAFEAKKQAFEKMKGIKVIAEAKKEIAATCKGLSPQEKFNQADVTAGQAEKKVISFEGLAGVAEAVTKAIVKGLKEKD